MTDETEGLSHALAINEKKQSYKLNAHGELRGIGFGYTINV